MKKSYSEITPYIKELTALSNSNNNIKADIYTEHNVKRGLRDLDGNGVVTPNGMNLKFEQFGGKLSGNYETGQWFKLEQNVNDEWKWLYGELKPGYYRLTKEIDFRESGKFYKELYEVYFAVE